jgi:hypothetical protein
MSDAFSERLGAALGLSNSYPKIRRRLIEVRPSRDYPPSNGSVLPQGMCPGAP